MTGKQRKNRDKRLDNLQPFQPGESGNPNGRPPGSISLRERIKRHLREKPEDADAVIDALFSEAKGGSHQHINTLIENVDGKVPDEKLITVPFVSRLPEIAGFG